MYSVLEFLILLASWILGGAVVFGLYYLLYKRILKKKGTITSISFIVKAPLFIGCSNALLGVALYILFYVLSLGHSPSTLITVFFTILICYIMLAIPVFIGSIAITIVEYKKQLISSKKLGIVLLMNIICIISFFMFFHLCIGMLVY